MFFSKPPTFEDRKQLMQGYLQIIKDKEVEKSREREEARLEQLMAMKKIAHDEKK